MSDDLGIEQLRVGVRVIRRVCVITRVWGNVRSMDMGLGSEPGLGFRGRVISD